jgi:PAS domain S-box-containing protein
MDERADYFNVILESEKWIGLPAKWFLLVVGVLSTHPLDRYRSSPWLTAGMVLYALFTLFLTYRFGVQTVGPSDRITYILSYVMDIIFVSQVIYYSGGPSSEMYLLYVLLALKSAIYYPAWHEVLVFPFVLGPLYVFVLYLSVGSWYFLPEAFFLLRYGLLFIVVLAALYLGWLNERSHRREAGLRRDLAERSRDLDSKTQAMQYMASNLGNRVLELRTLQEGIKAINSALALEDVLRLIVTNASQVLEGAHCSVALLDDQRQQVASMAASDERVSALTDARLRLDKSVVTWVAHQGKPLLSPNVRQDSVLSFVSEELDAGMASISSVIGVPLFLGHTAMGALIATSPNVDAFTIEDLNLLNAFADQAAVAVKNARLYEQLVEEQKQTAQLYQHVQERRNELEAILRGIGDGVIVTDPDLNLLLMNPVATRIFHVKSDVTSSKPLFTVIPHQELTSLFQDALHGDGGPIVREISLSTGSKNENVYQALASPVLAADGRARGVVTVLRDITSQKELERMKSNFLSVVSHELKTPLHSIKGFVDIILMGKTGPVNETQRDFLSTVRDQTAHLQNLINDLLEFSRLESGQVKLRLTEVSMAEVATAVVSKLKVMADQGQVQLVNRVDPGIATVEADRMRIEQVLTNLVDNAIKFTAASGSVTINAADLGTSIQVSVADTGIGIPASELTRIFDRFYQVDSGSTRPYRGTGLGLTICKHIIEYHRGKIWVESQEGKGSTFFFVLPKHIVMEDDQLLLDFLSLPNKEQEQNT